MLKKKISISFISLSAMILLLSSVVPHHHHDGGVTHFMTACCTNHTADDAGHDCSSDTDACDNQQSCIAESEFIISSSGSEKKCGLASCDHTGHDYFHFFLPCILIADFLACNIDEAGIKPEYGEYLLFDTSLRINPANGLRAPPFSLS